MSEQTNTNTSTTSTSSKGLLGRLGRFSTSQQSINQAQHQSKVELKSIQNLSKQLKSNCDTIFSRSIPFVIESNLLWSISQAINSLTTNSPNLLSGDELEVEKNSECILFLSDFFELTPSLVISLSLSVESSCNSLPGSMDLSLFRSLEFLELKKIPSHMISGISSIKGTLKKLRCFRCLNESISEILSPHKASNNNDNSSSSNSTSSTSESSSQQPISCIWPELQEIDCSFNRISTLDSTFELTPSLEILNLSRNKISKIDEGFSRTLSTLTVLNLSYNQLKEIPALPPNLKVFLLSHNYISEIRFRGNARLDTLDLTSNMISNEAELLQLTQLGLIKNLCLLGNPISYLDNYRNTVCSYLNRNCLVKGFQLDSKRLSYSEIRYALEQIKLGTRFTPFKPSVLSSLQEKTISPSANQFDHIKSLTQSYDSNASTSSYRSSCRKKPKIRDSLGPDSPTNENLEKELTSSTTSSAGGKNKKQQQHRERKKSNESCSSIEKTITEDIKETKTVIESLREKYGEENWLLKQAGNEVGKILGIPETPPPSIQTLFKQTRTGPISRESTYYSLLNESSMISSNSNNNIYNNNESLLEERESSIDNSASSDGILFYSCQIDGKLDDDDDETNASSIITQDNTNYTTILDEETYSIEEDCEYFTEISSDIKEFRIFQSGAILKLLIFEDFLYQIQPISSQQGESPSNNDEIEEVVKNLIIAKWDLNSLKGVVEEKTNVETDAVEFTLCFDTFKRTLREKTFIMDCKDFSNFDAAISSYIQAHTLKEFSDAFECCKCNAQFSRKMASRVVTKNSTKKSIKEVIACPNCNSDLVVPLESAPLPNNENIDKSDFDKPLKSSTPVSGGFQLSSSIPLGNYFFNSLDTTTTKSSAFSFANNNAIPALNFNDCIGNDALYLPNSSNWSTSYGGGGSNISNVLIADVASDFVDDKLTNSNRGSGTNTRNTRSDSDIEVLSCDSSSIEVLARNESSTSGIEVLEGYDIEILQQSVSTTQLLNSSKLHQNTIMSESTSSGSCTESICTAIDKGSEYSGGSSSAASTTSTIKLSSNHSITMNSTDGNSTICETTIANTTTTTIGGGDMSLYSSSPRSLTFSYNPQQSIPIKYDYKDFTSDHRLQLFCDILFKPEENLIGLVKVILISESLNPFPSIVVFSNQRIHLFKIIGMEGDNPKDWLKKVNCFNLSKLLKLDVLIGRHGIGIDFNGKNYYALLFRDSERTSNFIDFFMDKICIQMDLPPIVRDFSQTQKALMSPKNPISYFGIIRQAYLVIDNSRKSFFSPAIVLTDIELLLIDDLSWFVEKMPSITAKATTDLTSLRQIECMEGIRNIITLIFEEKDRENKNYKENNNPSSTIIIWELKFETDEETEKFLNYLKGLVKNIPLISLSEPIEP